MENSQQTANKQPATFRDRAIFFIGVLILIMACAFLVGSIVLDITGEKAIGELSNVASCSGNRTCFTGKVEFTTHEGQQVIFYPNTLPTFYDIDTWVSDRPYEEYGNHEVRYLASYPKIAKVKLSFFLEYINMGFGLCAGAFFLLISSIFSSRAKARKPLVIDLSRFRKGNK